MIAKREIAILGGAFNPITCGHIQLADFVNRHVYNYDEMWLMPCYEHRYGKSLVDGNLRIQMCEASIDYKNNIRVSDYEIKHELGGKTYDLIKMLIEDYKDCNFSWIIGQDNANSIHKWYKYEKLLELVKFVVVSRQGIEPHGDEWYRKSPHTYLPHETDIMEISSTQVRNHLCNNELDEAKKYLHPKVFELIQYYNLYRDQLL